MHEFDELYAISDTHFGGVKEKKTNFQVFDRGDRLSSFIRYVTARNGEHDIAIVINGDMIDSLAEPDVYGYVALDARSAIKMNILQRTLRTQSLACISVHTALAIDVALVAQ